ncbi:MAG: glycosyltransferase family 39 protein [Planctomycetota bacterium]
MSADQPSPKPSVPRPSPRGRIGIAGFVAAVLLLTAAATGLRIYNLGEPGLWNDEFYTVADAIRLGEVRLDKMLGYVPTRVMLELADATHLRPTDENQRHLNASDWQDAGLTPFLLRLPTAIVGIVTIPLVAVFAWFALGPRLAIALAFLYTVCPWHIYWSQAARFYSLQVMFMSVALLAYWAGIRARSAKWQIVAGSAFALSVLSQPNAVILALVPCIDFALTLVRRRPLRMPRTGMVAWAAAGVVTAGIIGYGIQSDREAWSQFVAAQEPSGLIGAIKLPIGVVYIMTPVLMLAAVVGAIQLGRRNLRLNVYLSACALVPALGYSAWALGNNVGLRYLYVALFGLLALAAVGLARTAGTFLRSRRPMMALVPYAILLAGIAPLLASYYTTGYGFHPRWADAYNDLVRERLPGERVAGTHPIVGSFYLREPVELMPADAATFDAQGETIIAAVESDMLRPWMAERAERLSVRDIRALEPDAEVQILRLHPRPVEPAITLQPDDPDPQ